MVVLLLLAGASIDCSRAAGAGRIEPGVEQQTVAQARPTANRFALFNWSLREGQSRFSGVGAARIAVDYRARLDLFGPQDVPYLSAILRDDRLLLPAGVPARLVPPAPLLWSALGVIRPPAGAALASATATELAYRGDDGSWTFRVRNGVMTGAEWRAADGSRHTVELEGARAGAPPTRATYRDWQEYRELVLELDQLEDVDAFPPETWTLDSR